MSLLLSLAFDAKVDDSGSSTQLEGLTNIARREDMDDQYERYRAGFF